MLFSFPPAPAVEGLFYIGVKPVFFSDHRSGQRIVFPVYSYREEATGELILVAEDQYEPILDKMIEKGVYGARDGQA